MNRFLDRPKATREGEELDRERLERYLRDILPDENGPLVIEQFPSGHSNLTYSVRLGELDLVLRRPPVGSKVKSAHDMGREYRVLSKLHKAFGPAPETVCYCEDESVLGAPFYVMHRVKGVILRRDPPEGLDLSPELVRRMGESFLDNLVELHGLDYEAIGLGDLGKPEGYVRRQVEGWTKRYYDSQTDELEDVKPVSQWLADNMPAESPAAIIHNDYKYDNVILDEEDLTRIVGVLDWEMCTLGHPLMDLGTAISYWIDPHDPPDLQYIRWGPTTLPGSPTRRDLVTRYGERIGRDVSQMAFYLTFAYFKTAVVAQQIYYRYKQGVTKDERFAQFIEATKILLRAAMRTIETGKV